MAPVSIITGVLNLIVLDGYCGTWYLIQKAESVSIDCPVPVVYFTRPSTSEFDLSDFIAHKNKSLRRYTTMVIRISE